MRFTISRLLLMGGFAALLAGCTSLELAVDTAKRVQPAPEPAPSGGYKVGKPYMVEGQWYYPRVDYAYLERGVASWYGPNFDGKLTANGELFDMRKVSAAHKTLPLPSVVRVTNLENGRSLVVRVNDRGPFVTGRIIDLSQRAAELLGFADKGTAMVEVQVMAEESRQAALSVGAGKIADLGPPAPEAAPSVEVTVERLEPVDGVAVAPRTAEPVRTASNVPGPAMRQPPPYGGMSNVEAGESVSRETVAIAPALAPQAAASSEGAAEVEPNRASGAVPPGDGSVTVFPVARQPSIFVQAGAFARFDNANRLRARLVSLGHPVQVTQVYVTNQPMFRVRVGPLSNVQDADLTLDRIIVAGYPDARIVLE